LLNKENGGHATGLNAAFGVAQGDIVCFLDSDDLFELPKLEVLVERMRRDEDSACVLHASVRTDDVLRPKGRTPLLMSLPSGWRGPEVLRTGGLLAYMPGTAGLNLRRKLADVLFPLPTTKPLNAFPDMVVARLAPLFSRLASINEPLAKVRLHSSNTYQRFRITAKWLRRELEISQHLWELQHHRLEGIRPSLGSALAPLDSAQVVLLEQYIAARLERKDDWGAYARRFFAHLATHHRPLWELAFWKGTSLLPLPWFDTAVNTALGPSRTKQLVSKLKIFAQFRIARDPAREYAG
jgi:Glycosyl transferase family 2